MGQRLGANGVKEAVSDMVLGFLESDELAAEMRREAGGRDSTASVSHALQDAFGSVVTGEGPQQRRGRTARTLKLALNSAKRLAEMPRQKPKPTERPERKSSPGQRRVNKKAARRFILHALAQCGVKIDKALLRGPRKARDNQASSLTGGSVKVRRCASCTRPLYGRSATSESLLCPRCSGASSARTASPPPMLSLGPMAEAPTDEKKSRSLSVGRNEGALSDGEEELKRQEKLNENEEIDWLQGEDDLNDSNGSFGRVPVLQRQVSEEEKMAIGLVEACAKLVIHRNYRAFFANPPSWGKQKREERHERFLNDVQERSLRYKERRRQRTRTSLASPPKRSPPPLVRHGSISSLKPFESLTISAPSKPCVLLESVLEGGLSANTGEVETHAIAGALPKGRMAHAVERVPGGLVVLGGWRGAREGGAEMADLSRALILDTQSLKWSEIPLSAPKKAFLCPRAQHTMTFFPEANKIIIFAGATMERISNDMLVLDLASTSLAPPRSNPTGTYPRPRKGHSGVRVIDSSGFAHLFVFGGSDFANQFNDCFLFSFRKSSWVRLRASSPPPPRSNHAAVPIESKPSDGTDGKKSKNTTEAVLVYGGRAGEHVLGDTWILILATNDWRCIDDGKQSHGPGLRYGHTLTTLPGSFSGSGRYLVVGGKGVDGEALSDAWVLHNARGKWWWSRVDPNPPLPGITGHAAVVAADKRHDPTPVFATVALIGGSEEKGECDDRAMRCLRCIELKEGREPTRHSQASSSGLNSRRALEEGTGESPGELPID